YETKPKEGRTDPGDHAFISHGRAHIDEKAPGWHGLAFCEGDAGAGLRQVADDAIHAEGAIAICDLALQQRPLTGSAAALRDDRRQFVRVLGESSLGAHSGPYSARLPNQAFIGAR